MPFVEKLQHGTKSLLAALILMEVFSLAGTASDDVPLGFETGDWTGIELTAEQVKTGAQSGLWKDHQQNKSVSSGKIPHDWSEFSEMRLWIFNAGKKPISMMVVLVSREDPKAFSYFGYRLTADWEGWKEVSIPLVSFQGRNDPAGWQKIDSVMFSVDGWGLKPDPEAVLYLDGLTLRKPSIRPPSVEEQAALEKVKKQFLDYEREAGQSSVNEEQVRTWMKLLTPEGTWPDVNYEDHTGGYWRAMDHLTRLKKMCLAYTATEGPLQGDSALSTAIHSALGHWLKKDYSNPNWWHNEIGVPRELSAILLLLDSELIPRERAEGVRIVSRAVIDSPPHGGRGVLTGQNRVWVAANALTQGLLASDYELVQRARNVIFEEVSVATQPGGAVPIFTRTGRPGEVLVSTQEGIQPDYSFFQHGPLLQLGNYGLAFAGDSAKWMAILRGTPLAPEPEKIKILRDYILKGERPVTWKGRMDINACGRQLGPQSPASKGSDVLRYLQTAKMADPAHPDQYDAAAAQISRDASGVPAENRYFWRADFMVHRRPGFHISTRMSSSRVLAAELVNGENQQGGYSGDGATYLYVKGNEYEDIFPVWDWSRLPGVTSPLISDKKLLKPRNWKITNSSDFVGGISDGEYGVATLTLDRDGLTARKSWFYFDDEIVCLGAGISRSTGDLPIVSSVNQCLARGDVLVDAGKAQPGILDYTDLKWAWHDGVGYLFPEPLPVSLGVRSQEGKWDEVSASSKLQGTVTKDVFSIWINHGDKPKENSYAYSILPGASVETVKVRSGKPEIVILQNTAALQAVRNVKTDMIQAVFYQPGTLEAGNGKTLKVDQPCLLILDASKNRLVLSDPTQKLTQITVEIGGAARKYLLPTGAFAGSSLVTKLDTTR
ncbi:hypothetical protein BH09VER1_BH09VER1_43060 [soil metagenome]